MYQLKTLAPYFRAKWTTYPTNNQDTTQGSAWLQNTDGSLTRPRPIDDTIILFIVMHVRESATNPHNKMIPVKRIPGSRLLNEYRYEYHWQCYYRQRVRCHSLFIHSSAKYSFSFLKLIFRHIYYIYIERDKTVIWQSLTKRLYGGTNNIRKGKFVVVATAFFYGTGSSSIHIPSCRIVPSGNVSTPFPCAIPFIHSLKKVVDRMRTMSI